MVKMHEMRKSVKVLGAAIKAIPESYIYLPLHRAGEKREMLPYKIVNNNKSRLSR